jgi:hypothetical protein
MTIVVTSCKMCNLLQEQGSGRNSLVMGPMKAFLIAHALLMAKKKWKRLFIFSCKIGAN